MPITFQSTGDEQKQIRKIKLEQPEDFSDRLDLIWKGAVERAGRRL